MTPMFGVNGAVVVGLGEAGGGVGDAQKRPNGSSPARAARRSTGDAGNSPPLIRGGMIDVPSNPTPGIWGLLTNFLRSMSAPGCLR